MHGESSRLRRARASAPASLRSCVPMGGPRASLRLSRRHPRRGSNHGLLCTRPLYTSFVHVLCTRPLYTPRPNFCRRCTGSTLSEISLCISAAGVMVCDRHRVDRPRLSYELGSLRASLWIRVCQRAHMHLPLQLCTLLTVACAPWVVHCMWLRWVGANGRVVLLGDAAHPPVPYIGQGAMMAIEDVGVLTHLLRHYCCASGTAPFDTSDLPLVRSLLGSNSAQSARALVNSWSSRVRVPRVPRAAGQCHRGISGDAHPARDPGAALVARARQDAAAARGVMVVQSPPRD